MIKSSSVFNLGTPFLSDVVIGIEVFLDVRAGANEVAIPVGLVDASNGWPHLAPQGNPFCRMSSFLARVAVSPLVGGAVAQRVGSILQHIVRLVDFASLNLGDLCSYHCESFHKSIELELVLTFGRLDHQATRNGPAHRRCMEAVVHQSLRDVLLGHPGRLLEHAAVKDEFVGNSALVAPIKHLEVILEYLSHIISI